MHAIADEPPPSHARLLPRRCVRSHWYTVAPCAAALGLRLEKCLLSRNIDFRHIWTTRVHTARSVVRHAGAELSRCHHVSQNARSAGRDHRGGTRWRHPADRWDHSRTDGPVAGRNPVPDGSPRFGAALPLRNQQRQQDGAHYHDHPACDPGPRGGSRSHATLQGSPLGCGR